MVILRSSTRSIIAAFTIIIGVLGGTAGAGLVLVEDGVSLAPVIIYEGAPPRTVQAAYDLAEYIGKISGVRPEVLVGQPLPLPERAIWVGYQPVLEELFSSVDFGFRHPEEILIVADSRNLVVAGRDRWDDERLDVDGAGFTFATQSVVRGVQSEYGTANAVYTFIQDILGVRWLWPGELGESVPSRSSIVIDPIEYRYHPPLRSRNGLFWRLGLHRVDGTPGQIWARNQRVVLDSLELEGAHAFGDWWEKYHEEHPEYFALQPDGTRSGFPSPKHAKLCVSNPDVWQRWLQQVEEQRAANPGRQVFIAASNDGWAAGHCMCEDCRAWDNTEAEFLMFNWHGIVQQYVALSDREVTFANTLAGLLREKYPDEELFVQIHAYGLSRPAPVEAVPADNVIISSVSNFPLRPDSARVLPMEQYDAWSKVAPNMMFRPNLGLALGWHQGLPRAPFTRMAEDFRFIAERGTIGIYFDTVPTFFWSTQGPLYYLMAQLAWDPMLDADEVMADYYRHAYGPAAGAMAAYWELFEALEMEVVASDSSPGSLPEIFNDQLLDRAAAYLELATEKVADVPGKYAARVGFAKVGFDYTRLMVEMIGIQQAVRGQSSPDARLMERAAEIWAEMRAMARAHPEAFRPRNVLNL